MRLLAIVAHPDDASIFCGGTLARHSQRGDEVHVAYLTRGGYGGTANQSESELADRRAKEARDAGAVLGVSTSFLGFKDGRVEDSLQARRKLVDTIRKHRPQLIVTHAGTDDHPDHRATAQLVHDAYYEASLPLAASSRDPCDPDNIYAFGKLDTDFEPEVYVDVTAVRDTKDEAIKRHESQVEFLEEHGGIDRRFDDLLEDVRARDRLWGRRSGVRYAEGFARLHDRAFDYLE